jgi:hypothetical protein
MGERINISPFLGVSLTLLFTFSTLYTLMYYYDQGSNAGFGLDGPTESDGSFVGFDTLFNAISWLNPFGFIKLLLSSMMSSTPELYQIIDMLLLRPIGWFVFLVQGNYLLSLVPTVAKGE